MSQDVNRPLHRRGRPRNPASRAAILRAARELMADGGLAAVSMEAVAARAGVSKPTVYRWWPDRHAVAMAALMEQDGAAGGVARAGRSPLTALRRQLEAVARTFTAPMGRNAASMIAAANPDTEIGKAFRNHFALARREEGRTLLEAAQRSGALRADVDVDAALDAIYGALFFRLLLGHAPLDGPFIRRLLDVALEGLRMK